MDSIPQATPHPSTSAGRRTRRPFTLSEKLAIVRESLDAGVKAATVARRHGIALNLLYYWRRVYGEVATGGLAGDDGEAAELRDLRLQVRNLERLLGRSPITTRKTR